jgi:hypothetical protein
MTSHFRSATDGTSDLSDDEMSGYGCASLFHVLESKNIQSGVTENKVRALLESGADVNYRNREGRTPIMVAAGKRGSLRMMQILLDHGADLCAQDLYGKTALMVAICAGLHERGSDVNQQNQKGLSPLKMAACPFPTDPIPLNGRPGVPARTNYLKENTPSLVLRSMLRPNSQFMETCIFGIGFDSSDTQRGIGTTNNEKPEQPTTRNRNTQRETGTPNCRSLAHNITLQGALSQS